jgi:selenocysteine lyase/cysteine desulfurase
MDWSREFPGLTQTTYLNSCAHGLLPRRTRAALERHLDLWTGHPDWDAWNAAIEDARAGFARLIGAHDDEVAVQANATSGLAAVMNALPATGARREVLTCDLDFPTAPFLARRQMARGMAHRHLKTAGGPLRVDEWRRALGPQTALACVPGVASFTGYRFDVAAFARAAHEAGAPLLVDHFQGAGTFPLDVHRADVDFLVTGVYKWLLGPVGLAFLYVKREHHGLLPTTSGWYGARAPYAFNPMDDLAPDARRFQYGGASVMGCVAASESLRLLGEVGLGNVERHNRALVERVMEGARERKWEVLTPEAPEERASIVTFRVPDLEGALAACAREKVVVNARLGGIRVSPHFYNRAEDVDRLFAVLDAAAR